MQSINFYSIPPRIRAGILGSAYLYTYATNARQHNVSGSVAREGPLRTSVKLDPEMNHE